ncbi:OmpA/MotB family protein [Nocardioides iriomotensis]|jgi:chemotaxis protein MotB|uniref:Flagellar motor protein MotB n=1 Tax=Nocardioides iriomotensis TaxID=715784 RepID=A0A4V1Z1D6_9ACTN|nr:flagellar motor protein MotB [Nocardioides iriomotensis]RYU10536.1 flagellar motor protein MotB [Nocardioides iriomotensis]
MSRKKKHEEHEEHANHERWLVSYADMMTLLMVLFIVLFAISQVDQKKFNELREGMAAGFGQQPSPFQGDRSVLAEAGVAPMAPIAPGQVTTETDQTAMNGEKPQATSEQAQQAAEERNRNLAEAIREVNRLEELRKKVDAALRKHGLADDVSMRIDERGLRISLVSRHIVFAPNVADLSPRGVRVLDVIAPVLHDLDNQIEVAGHTNQVNVKPKYYPSDWELSAARAVTVLRHLKERGGVPGHHMVAAAYGHEQPLIDPSKPGSQELNKRVDILVLSTARDEVRALFDEALRTQHLT